MGTARLLFGQDQGAAKGAELSRALAEQRAAEAKHRAWRSAECRLRTETGARSEVLAHQIRSGLPDRHRRPTLLQPVSSFVLPRLDHRHDVLADSSRPVIIRVRVHESVPSRHRFPPGIHRRRLKPAGKT